MTPAVLLMATLVAFAVPIGLLRSFSKPVHWLITLLIAFISAGSTALYIESSYQALPSNTEYQGSWIKRGESAPRGVCTQSSFFNATDCMFTVRQQPLTIAMLSVVGQVKPLADSNEVLAPDIARFTLDAPGFPVTEVVTIGDPRDAETLSWMCQELKNGYLPLPNEDSKCRQFFERVVSTLVDYPAHLTTPLFNQAASKQLISTIRQQDWQFSYHQGMYTIANNKKLAP